MQIQIIGIVQTWRRSLEEVIRLFDPLVSLTFEEENVKIGVNSNETDGAVYSDRDTFDLVLEYVSGAKDYPLLEANDRVEMEFSVNHESQMYRTEITAGPQKQAIRQALCRLAYLALADWSKEQPPWGILTGIRPTKLMHLARLQGEPVNQTIQRMHKDLLIHPDKSELMARIVEQQLKVLPDLDQLREQVSIYIGIPYCPTKCAYCTFPAYDIRGSQGTVPDFLRALHQEIASIGEWLQANNVEVTTVYYGGGTPTSISADEMDRLYAQVNRSLPNPQRIREVTVEAGRPDTITAEKLAILQKWQVDRISINPQSYRQETLEAIGRDHTVEQTLQAFSLAREAECTNINMDLIVGLPNETPDDFRHTLAQTKKLRPETLTVHALAYKRASSLTKARQSGNAESTPAEDIAEMIWAAEKWTAEQGYEPYYLYRQKAIVGNLENVGYTLPNKACLYNILIMEEVQTIIGLGSGAASKWVDPSTGNIERTANPKEPKAYIEQVEEGIRAKKAYLEQVYNTN